MKLYANRLEDKIWAPTLTRLARHFGSNGPVEMDVRVIDERRLWNQFANIWENSAIRPLASP